MSSCLSFFAKSGNFLKILELLNHNLFGIAGNPLITSPSFTSEWIPHFELAITLFPTFTLLFTPTWPASITPSPIIAPPAIPTWAAKAQFFPIFTPWPICTKLSIFVPSPIIVSPTAGLSIQQLVPISTELLIITPPVWGTFSHFPSFGIKPKPSEPKTVFEFTIQLSFIFVFW